MRESIDTSKQTTRRNKMFAHYYSGKIEGKKVHMIHITPTPSLNAATKHVFDTAKEAKAFAKAQGAKAWNY